MNKEELIYDLIFSENTEYKIDVSSYISDIYRYDRFIDEVKLIMKKSRVTVIKEKVLVDSNSVIWVIKVKK